METADGFLGCPCGVKGLRAMNDKLNAKVVEQVNNTQELVMLNNFAREANECQFKKCLQERISDIASWRWVLQDLAKRLDEAVETLQYEHNALRVVIERVQKEMDVHSREASRPGAFGSMTDIVEEAILQEFNFLRDHKRKFEKLILELEKQIKSLKKTKSRIDVDILRKQQALSVEEDCANIDLNTTCKHEGIKKKRRRASPIHRWENRCASLKRAGLRAMSNAVVTRQQVRGARVHLSIAAQAYAARVDSALRRRLQSNRVKLQDLKWQRDEALKDYKSLEEEQLTTERNLLETMDQERVIETRLADRSLRPIGELTKDEVDRKLRDELGRLRHFSKQLRTNLDRISSLQNHLADSMTRIDCYAEDLIQIVHVDEERIRSRFGEVPGCSCNCTLSCPPPITADEVPKNQSSSAKKSAETRLTAIKEEDENDDYPFDE